MHLAVRKPEQARPGHTSKPLKKRPPQTLPLARHCSVGGGDGFGGVGAGCGGATIGTGVGQMLVQMLGQVDWSDFHQKRRTLEKFVGADMSIRNESSSSFVQNGSKDSIWISGIVNFL